MEIKIVCQKDSSINNWVRDLKGKNYNYGASELLISEGTFNIPIFDFDLSCLKGKEVKKAWLYLRYQEYPMMKYEISTITAPWEEGTGNGIDDPKLDGATAEMSGKNEKWINGGRFPGFIFGNQNSTYCLGEPQILEDNWQRMEIDPSLIYDRVYDQAYGFALVDARANMFENEKVSPWEYKAWNKNVYSRESQYCPYLLIEYEDAESLGNPSIESIKALSFPYSLRFDKGQMLLEWEIDGLSQHSYFKLYYKNGEEEHEAGTWETPKYNASKKIYTTVLTNLEPSHPYEIRLELWDLTGKKAEKAFTATSTPAKERPKVDVLGLKNPFIGQSVLSDGLYILDENTKVNPITGDIYFNELDGKHYTLETIPSYINDEKIRLKGVRNEFLAFQLIGRGMTFDTDAQIEDVKLRNEENSLDEIEIYKVWYVEEKGTWYPEVAVPTEQDLSKIVGWQPVIPNQNYQSYYIEILIPQDAVEGIYRGNIDIGFNDKIVSLPIEIDVLSHTLDNKTDFICDLNAYGPAYSYQDMGYSRNDTPDENGLKFEEAYYKVAHAHRTNYDPLSYTHTGVVYGGYTPEIEGEGENIRVKSWEAWDKRFEKYFNGEAFKDCPRSGVPIANMYLPIHENWPSSLNKHYKVKVESKDYPALLNEHYQKATLPENDFAEEHRIEIKQILKEFIRHIDEKGWKDVEFQYFFNNKHYYKNPNMEGNSNPQGISWWCLDEPFYRDDWYALEYFARILREAREETQSGDNVVFRADLSFAYIQFYYLDNLLDVSCTTSNTYIDHPNQVKIREEQFDEKFWLYGSANNPTVSNMNTYGTIMMVYLSGANGFVPWNNIANIGNYKKPSPTAILYPAGKAGFFKPNASLRLKMMRRVLQDIEYLKLVQEKYGYDMEQLNEIVKELIEFKVAEQKVDLEVTAQEHSHRYYIDSLNIRELALSLL